MSAALEETADIETASDDYARRFAGPTGEWLLSVQERITFELLAKGTKGSVLDVGGGHGQLAVPLARAGWDVTVLGSDDSTANRIRPLLDAGELTFQKANLIALPYADQSFDHVICFRYISHCGEWRQLVKELCRVARTSVILDYPPLFSWNFLTPLLFHVKKRLEGNTRTYTLFRHRELAALFAAEGFPTIERRGQFFLPMVIHRKLKNPAASAALESVFRATSLTEVFGSPTIARASRTR